MLKTTLLAVLLFPLTSYAEISLKSLSPAARVTVSSGDHSDSCTTLAEDLRAYRDERADLDRRTVDTLHDVANVMDSWYGQLSRIEGLTLYIPYGSFRNIGASAITAERNARFYEREYFEAQNQLSALIEKANKCIED